ncbi:MAG: metallophosphoesterase, partial [Deltaproteobacteria bacterium]|nr:metallophosphoesterase [Deltaproteobacteria bacterium]
MRLVLAGLLAVVVSCATRASLPPDSSEPIHLTIVATNDFHGWLTPHERPRPEGGTIQIGGVDLLASFVSTLRCENPGGVLLVDGGDLFQGTLASNLTEGAAVIEAYNRLGYDAAALGNHEFDFGPVGIQVTVHGPGEDPLGAIKERVKEAQFPVVASNVTEKGSKRVPSWLRTGTIVEKNG